MGRRPRRLARRAGDAALPADRARGRDLTRRRSPRLLPGLVDAHAHLQHERFAGILDAVLARAVDAGIERILVPGWDLPSSEAALALAAAHPDLVDAAVGIHPHDAAGMDEAQWGRLEQLVADPRTRAVGEIGLDFHRNFSPPDVQRAAFSRQLALAAQHGLPVIVHDRDAHADVTEALLAWAGDRDGDGPPGMLHAFSGDAAMAERLGAAGFLVSFALPVAFRSATGPREAASSVPDDAFLVETDSPYLGPDRSATNEPTTVLRVVAEVARLRGTTPTELVAPIRRAYDRLIVPRPARLPAPGPAPPAPSPDPATPRDVRGYLIGALGGLVVVALLTYLVVFAR